MANRYQLSDGRVILADAAFIATRYPNAILLPSDDLEPEPDAPEPSAPTPPRIISRLAFRDRFTLEEKVRIYEAAESVTEIKVFLDDIAASEQVDLDSPSVIVGLASLEASGIIAEWRAAEIVA
ncbi:hypothetical protein FACS1894185_4800 [Betaproteobacteria bacterium]|nr:hypothetical protein FACS1894185_4800 [Betaproteobacteria bacterium]